MFENIKKLLSIDSMGGKKTPVKLMKKFRSSRLEVFCKKRVLKNFAKLTTKHLRWTPFLIGLEDSSL